MMLETFTYFGVRRDDHGRPNQTFERLFTMALRWYPDYGTIDEETFQRGVSALSSLNNGNNISWAQLIAADDYLNQAIDHYRTARPEPYEGRNNEAIKDLSDLQDALAVGR